MKNGNKQNFPFRNGKQKFPKRKKWKREGGTFYADRCKGKERNYRKPFHIFKQLCNSPSDHPADYCLDNYSSQLYELQQLDEYPQAGFDDCNSGSRRIFYHGNR